ncbi:hypothetical protein JNW90_14945 [Micromonospora sp. STR1s_5]|nr:hypothetical protein [Micromonospora sp. STR1s_5]
MTDAVVHLSSPTSWRVDTEGSWNQIGFVEECTHNRFFVRAATLNGEVSNSPLSRIDPGPYSTLGEAMAAIAAKLGGKCTRLAPLGTNGGLLGAPLRARTDGARFAAI